MKKSNYYTVCYINNCANEGVIIGNNSNSNYYDAYVFCMSTGTPHVATPKKIVAEALTDAQFKKGIMIGGDMKIEILLTDNTVSFVGDTTAKVDRYLFRASIGFSKQKIDATVSGTEQFVLDSYITANEYASNGFSFKHINKVVLTTDSNVYANVYEQNKALEIVYNEKISYVLVDQADGSVMVVAKINDPNFIYTCADGVSYIVVGFDTGNLSIAHGSKQVDFEVQ